MMLHRHFDDQEEPKQAEADKPKQAEESGVTAEGADIVTEPVQPKTKRTRKKGA